MTDRFTILVVDDNEMIVKAIIDINLESNFQISGVYDGESALKYLNENHVDLLILDMRLPDTDGLTLLKSIKMIDKSITVIIMTGFATIEDAVKATQIGAFDFIEKTRLGTLLPLKINQVFKLWEQKSINEELKIELAKKGEISKIIGNSSPIQKLRDIITRVSQSDSTVLIQGETGTGKELVAQEIHQKSSRCNAPFVPIDCAAITDSTFESEFFGHSRGAYTGADKATIGLFRAADKGTIFFDEIGEMSLEMQSKLLRTIQEHEIRPVGSTKYVKIDFRVIAATNRNLEKEVQANRFRKDLYYRLNTITLECPPLREREDDVILLSRYFLHQFSINTEQKILSPEVIEKLQMYNWPGNVRELQNVIKHISALCQSKEIMLEDIPEKISGFNEPILPENEKDCYGVELADNERTLILQTLKIMNGNKRKAAKHLGIGEATIYRKLKKYGL